MAIPIRVCRARHITEPVVEQEIVLSHGTIDGYLVLRKVFDGFGSTG